MTERQKADYWDKRIREIFDSNAKQKRIKEIYRTAYDNVEADILKLFEKFEEGQELTETELYRFDRFIQLQKGIKAQCTDAGKELNTEVYSRLNEAYKSTFETAKEVYDLPGTWGVQNKKMAEQCIKTVWSGMHFSERIWRNARNKLAPRIERHVIDCVIGGRSKDECIKEIRRDFDVGFNDADRLVRTEVMSVINRAQCETYASEGIKKVKWITGRDNRMCEHCGSLEGKIFELSADGTLINPKTGISQPAIVHPRCRCTIIPVVEFEDKGLTNAVNGGIIKEKDDRIMNINNIDSPIEQRNTGKGNPNAILIFDRPLNNRQLKLLEQLKGYDSRVTVAKKNVNMRDLSALTAHTGDEFALFTKGNERLVVRGNSNSVNIDIEKAKELSKQGYKWSGHTHPGIEKNTSMPSAGDKAILKCFTQEISVIYNSKGQHRTFEKE